MEPAPPAFLAYPKIVHPSEVVRDALTHAGLLDPDVVWVATEKIHGSNLAFVATRGEALVRLQRRTGWLAAGEKFHGVQTDVGLTAIGDRVRAMLETVPLFAEATQLVVYGEVFSSRVQRGMSAYGPALRFVAFDILVVDRAHGAPVFLSYADMAVECARAGIPAASVLCEAPFAELTAELDAAAVETLASQYALHGSLIAEGVVLRPKFRVDAWTPTRPTLVKVKRAAFREQSAAPIAAAARLAEAAAVVAAAGLVTPGRLESVRSKQLEDVRADVLARALAEDALADAKREPWYASSVDTDKAQRRVWRAVRQAAAALVKATAPAAAPDGQ